MTKISLSKLKRGSKILLETRECVFEMEVYAPLQGKVRITGGKRFLDKTNAVVVGSYGALTREGEERLQHPNEIERGIGVQMSYTDNDGISIEFVTSPVISGRIYGKADGQAWEYEVWPDDERNKRMAQAVNDARARLRINQKNEDTDL